MRHMKKPDQAVITLTNVSKKYEIHHEKPTLVEKFIKGRNEIFWALNDINLTITKGERVGVIGPNGAGKTTLLKTITGITAPTTGTVVTHGKIVSLIDLEAGRSRTPVPRLTTRYPGMTVEDSYAVQRLWRRRKTGCTAFSIRTPPLLCGRRAFSDRRATSMLQT